MKFVSVRELGNRPRSVCKALEHEDLVLTAEGKPIGVLVGLEDGDLESTLEVLRRSRASLALARLRQRADENGAVRVSDEEIESEISVRRLRGALERTGKAPLTLASMDEDISEHHARRVERIEGRD